MYDVPTDRKKKTVITVMTIKRVIMALIDLCPNLVPQHLTEDDV